MSGVVGFQIALELTKVFPISDVVQAAGHHILRLARDLRKSGSDLVVEADLAEVFGRGKIVSELEIKFKAATKITNITPLTSNSEIVLDSGPGPTVINAFRDPRYFASVVQLSFLSWVHNREKLASMLSLSMTRRYERAIHGASPDPGYEGIMKTLAACSSQTSSFSWSDYVNAVQARLQAAIPNYAYSPDYLTLSPSLLLGAMDCLYLVQRLPEDRKISVSNENGSITLVIWAHYILGLTVAITGTPGGTILFGSEKTAHVTIIWSRETKEYANQLFWPTETEDEEPTVRLLDKSLSVILEETPDPEQKVFQGGTEERHPVADYGTTYLRRLFNSSLITPDSDPIYEESVKLITAMAIHANDHLDRQSRVRKVTPRHPLPPTPPQKWYVDIWRILEASKLLFSSINIDTAGVDAYAKFLSTTTLNEATCPNSFAAFLARVDTGSSSIPKEKRLLDRIQHMAKIVLIFAHVANLEKCADMPIILTDDHPPLAPAFTEVFKGPDRRGKVESCTLFHAVVRLLTETEFDQRDDDPEFSSRITHFLFLCGDFGWSVFLDTVGDKDPASVRSELICVQKGTPTNSKTGERKFKIRDGAGIVFRTADHPDFSPLTRGPDYLPRRCARVLSRQEYWSTRSQEFESSLYFKVEPSSEWYRQMTERITMIDDVTSYRAMHDSLWQTFLTPECEHEVLPRIEKPVKLGPDAVVLMGWSNALELMQPFPERILIVLTRSDPRLRWLAIVSGALGRGIEPTYREMMLRSPKCCDECALVHVASMAGRWTLIL